VRTRGALVIALLLPAVASAQQFTRVDVATDGSPGNGTSHAAALSADGRYVAFLSGASNLVANDTNHTEDAFVRDLQTATTTRVNLTSTGGQSKLGPINVNISGNGRFIVFNTIDVLVPQDTNQCQYGYPLAPVTLGCTDVYVYDQQTHQVSLESVATSGAIGDTHSYGVSISDDGRYLVFESASTTFGPNSPTRAQIYLRDRVSGTTTLIGRGQTPTYPGDGAISGDGSTVAFISAWDQNDTGDNPCTRVGQTVCSIVSVYDRTTGQTQVLDALQPTTPTQHQQLRKLSTDGRVLLLSRADPRNLLTFDAAILYDRTIPRVASIGGLLGVGFDLQGDGRMALTQDGDSQILLYDARLNTTLPVMSDLVATVGVSDAALSADGGRLAITTSVDPNDHTYFGLYTQGIFVKSLDADHDGLPDAWETRFGLDPTNPNDATADPDGDGKTNLQEFVAGTHPNGKFLRYLAEGSNNTVFSTRIAILNPQSTPATVFLRLQNAFGTNPLTLVRTVDAHHRATFDAKTEPLLANYGDFSTTIDSDVQIVADRTMSVSVVGHGSHAETSIGQPSTTWYFAEGATGGPFSLFYELQNPQDTSARVTVTYLLPAPRAPLVKTYDVAAQSRRTIFVDQEDPLLQSTDVSAKITSDQPVVAERSLYLASLGQDFGAATGGAGVPAPQLKWFLAEGATGSFFDLYVLLANAESTDADVKLTYLLPDGTNFSKTYTVTQQSRRTLLIDAEDPRLKDTAVSIIAESTNGVPIIVERAMWWPEGQWYEGHLSAGATTTATKWGLADGEVSWGESETYILIANTSSRAGQATVTLLFDFGDPIQVTLPLPANSRTNVPVSTLAPAFVNSFKRFGAIVESDGVDLVVERSMYANVNGVLWASGTSALGTPLP
jgi:hypothetical protein